MIRGRSLFHRNFGRISRRSRSRYALGDNIGRFVLWSDSEFVVLGDQAESFRYRPVLPKGQVLGTVRGRRANWASRVRFETYSKGQDEYGGCT